MPVPLSADGAAAVRAYAARVSAETDERDRATMREALCSARSATLRGHELGRLLAQGEAESDARKADDVDGLRSVLSDDDYTRFMAFVAERRMNMRVHRSDHEALWASYSPEQVEEARERICAALTAAAPED